MLESDKAAVGLEPLSRISSAMSQTQTDPSQRQPPAPTDDDPLAHLHKMSTTAGLGSGDYVAVNGTAVFAVLCGLASALALMSEMLLIIPLVGLVAAIMALQQIRHSNGTQTGKGLVALALAGSLGFGGFVVGRWATEGIRTSDDRKAIHQLIADFSAKVKTDDVNGAYSLFSSRFANRIDQQHFTDRLKILQNFYGKFTNADWNGLVQIQTDDATGERFGWTTVQLTFAKDPAAPLKDTAVMHKTPEGNWQFEAMSEIFPTPQQPGRGQRGQPGQSR